MLHSMIARLRQEAARQDHSSFGFQLSLFALLFFALLLPMPAKGADTAASSVPVTATIQAPVVMDDMVAVAVQLETTASVSTVPETYTVQPGDTLGSIAPRFGTTWQQLCSINALPNCNVIRVGQVLKLTGSVIAPPAPVPPAPAPAASAALTAMHVALAQVGKPYITAAAGPGGFDCSGLTMYAYRAAGISLPHHAATQATMGTYVPRSALRPGDLVFFYGGGHVGIYIGNGEVVHAPVPGDVVKVTSIAYMPYYTARRVA